MRLDARIVWRQRALYRIIPGVTTATPSQMIARLTAAAATVRVTNDTMGAAAEGPRYRKMTATERFALTYG